MGSHAVIGMLRKSADKTGLVDQLSEALIGIYRGVLQHALERLFTDRAVAVVDGANAISSIDVLTDW